MNLLLLLPVAPPLAETTAPAAEILSTGTVLLGLMALAVAWLASAVSNLRNEVADLKDALAAPARRPVPVASATPVPAGPTPPEMAAIAAAVHCVLGSGVRVVSVVPPDANAQAWSREGRREVFQSHQLR